MSIPLFTVVPNSQTGRDTFAPDMDQFISELNPWTEALNTAGNQFALGMSADSSTSATISTGTKSITVTPGKGFVPGVDLTIASTASPTNRMIGTCVIYDIDTGALVVSVSSVGGSGTFAAWSISLATNASMANQTFANPTFTGEITEQTYTLTGTDIDPANGTIQVKTLTANTTLTSSITAGQSVTLMIDDGAAYTITWPTMTWVGGVAPTLSLTKYTVICLWKVGTTLYGLLVGEA